MIQAERNTNPNKSPKEKKNRKPKSHRDLVEKITASKRVNNLSIRNPNWSSLFSHQRFRDKEQNVLGHSVALAGQQPTATTATNKRQVQTPATQAKKRPKNPTN
jgi:hypothetical protein